MIRNQITLVTWQLRAEFVLSLIVFSVGLFAGGLISGASTGDFSGNAGLNIEPTFTNLLINNASVYALIVLGSVLFALTTLFLLLNTGMVVGAISFGALSGGSSVVDLFLLIAPHAIVELPAFFIGGAISFRITRNLIQYLRRQRDAVFVEIIAREFAIVALFGMCLIVVGAYIEANITPIVHEAFK